MIYDGVKVNMNIHKYLEIQIFVEWKLLNNRFNPSGDNCDATSNVSFTEIVESAIKVVQKTAEKHFQKT